MRIEINSIGQVGKSLTVKRTKVDDDEVVVATLKFEDLLVDRETIDGLCYQPDGWANLAFFDELGAPRIRLVLGLSKKLKLTATGAIKGVKKGEAIKLTEAELTDIELHLHDKGALMCGALSWQVAGDEVSDLEPLLGRTCTVVATISDGGQQPLWGAATLAARRDTEVN
jgi:hypothetical protein